MYLTTQIQIEPTMELADMAPAVAAALGMSKLEVDPYDRFDGQPAYTGYVFDLEIQLFGIYPETGDPEVDQFKLNKFLLRVVTEGADKDEE